jgi:hypothetical protein
MVMDLHLGPFTADLIEPHVVLTHDMIDFDVSNLFVQAGYLNDLGERQQPTAGSPFPFFFFVAYHSLTINLGMRVDVREALSVEVDDVVTAIKNKRALPLRPKNALMKERIDKMIKRGWTVIDPPVILIPPDKVTGLSRKCFFAASC